MKSSKRFVLYRWLQVKPEDQAVIEDGQMGKMSKVSPLKISLTVSALLMLSACEFGLDELGDAIDRPPESGAFDANGTVDSNRPDEDANGIIRYPTYEVAVAQGPETVADVANRIGVDANRLATYNGVEPQTPLRKGEVLSIPPGALDGTTDFVDENSSALDSAPTTAPSVETGPEPVRHVVKEGETAFSIARLYNVSVTSLASWNGLDRDLNLRVGQRLLIPTGQAPSDDVATPAPPSADKPLPENEPKPVVSNPEPAKPSGLIKPVNGNIIRPYDGQRVEYGAPTGTKVVAAGDGTVANILPTQNGAQIILLRHADGLYTVYNNVTNVALKKNNKVKQGEPLGIIAGGNPPFLHFEVRKGTEAVDPASYIK